MNNFQKYGPDNLKAGIINCAVPYWDMKEFFAKGGDFTDSQGYFVDESKYLDDFYEWLPNKWRVRGTGVPALLPDMLPSTAWADNLRTRLTDQEWGRLRKFCYQAAGNTCVACGSRGEPHVEAHESWSFDEANGVQRLKGLLCLCPTCHKAKHLGYAHRLGILDKVYGRLCWLNDWSGQDLEAHLEKVQLRQEKLSQQNWTLDLSFLRKYGVR